FHGELVAALSRSYQPALREHIYQGWAASTPNTCPPVCVCGAASEERGTTALTDYGRSVFFCSLPSPPPVSA
ncbi:hypothetical protein M9458_033654, partial [Cirrhinus mrigala]